MNRELPSGTVTFLFTDIAGSTALLHELGDDAYAEALSAHRVVIRDAAARHSGMEVDTQGDAFFIAFARATDALAAAVDAQHALAEGPVQVRMGLHTGEPVLTDEGYVGVDVHRAARIAASGHGGQVLLSQATRDLCPTDGLRELGEHRLKDLSAPERIFQVGATEFPPLKTLYRTNLPIPATPFLGRQAEQRELREALTVSRLVTVTGPGGCGKTRLAIQVAADLADDFPDGVWWVPLGPISDPRLVRPAISESLSLAGDPESQIGDRKLALVLDNFEQVVDAALDVGALLASCRNVRLLVTSREPLQLSGEHEYVVPPLDDQDAAVLFAARAAAHGARVDATAARELCHRLDNLPLALELAAARTKLMSPTQLLERIGERLDLLRGGRDVDPRQRTLRATIEWSYELLTADEQLLFGRLAVFSGGWTLDAVEAICGADPDALQSLLDKSLIRARDGAGGRRLWMLETIRQYASERFDEDDEREALRARHAEWFATLGTALRDATREGEAVATSRLVDELPNFRTALVWAEERDEARLGAALMWALWFYWVSRGHSEEGLRWARWAEPRAERLDGIERVHGLTAVSEILRAFGDPEGSERIKRATLPAVRELGVKSVLAAALSDLASLAVERGDLVEGERLAEDALAVRRELGDPGGISHALGGVGLVEFRKADFARALAVYEEALVHSEQIGAGVSIMDDVLMVGECARRTGDVERARVCLRRALELAGELELRVTLPEVLQEIAAVITEPGLATKVLAAAERIRGETNQVVWDAGDVEQTETRLRETLGHDFAQAWSDGLALSDAEALALASAALDVD